MNRWLLTPQVSRKPQQLIVGLAIVASFLSGCAASDAAKRINAFSEAVTAASTNTANAFDTVERSYYQTQVTALTLHFYEGRGFNPEKVRRFLGPDQKEARVKVLDALKTYAQKLSDIMSNTQISSFDTQTKSFGQALLNLNKNNAVSNKVLNDTEIKVFATAVNTIGRWFIEYKREKEVRQIVREMKEPIRNICALLSKDIGKTGDEKGAGASGLRNQLWNQYSQTIRDQSALIDKTRAKLEPRAVWEEVAKLPALVRERETADSALEAVQKTLLKLAEAHDKLDEAFDKSSPTLEVLVKELIAEGERAKSFYDSLGKK